MPLRSDWSSQPCPIARSLDVLGDPWVLLIVRNLLHGTRTFDSLRGELGISEAVLARRLRAMRDAGLTVQVDVAERGRPRRAYAATEAAADLLPILQQLAVWGERYTALPPGGAHMAMVHRPCGQETSQGQVCSHCGDLLRPEDMIWDKPWRGARYALVGAPAPPQVRVDAT